MLTKAQTAKLREALKAVEVAEQSENRLYWTGIAKGILTELVDSQDQLRADRTARVVKAQALVKRRKR